MRIGDKIGLLTVKALSGDYCICQCECGVSVRRRQASLSASRTKGAVSSCSKCRRKVRRRNIRRAFGPVACSLQRPEITPDDQV